MVDRTVKVSLVAQVNNFVSEFSRAQQAVEKTGTAAEQATAKYQEQTAAMRELGAGLTAAGAVALVATGIAVKAAIDWESAWAGVTKTVDGSASEMAELETGLRDLARSLPATHEEIAAVAEAAGQLGVKRKDIESFTKVMIDLSETTNLTADEAATSIAQLMNVMQTAPEDVDNLGAALVALGNDGASTERDIVQMAQRIAGAGRVVGLTEAEVLAFANALASVGIEAEAGGSAISRVMTDIAMSVSEGGEKLEAFAKVAGMSSADFSKSFKETPAEAITTFIEGLRRINDSGGDVFATLSNLGQSDIRVSQALLGMANSGDLLRKSLDLGSKAWEENTALSDEAAKRYETTEAKLQIAANSAKDAAISYGSVFLPAVAAVAEAVANLGTGFSALPEGIQGTVAIMVTLAGVVAVAGGAFLLAVPKIAQFSTALAVLRASELPGVARAAGAVTQSITRTSGALGKTAAFLTGPWGVAIAAAGLGIAELDRLMKSMQSSAEEMQNALVTASEADDILRTAFKGAPDGFWFDDGARSIDNFRHRLELLSTMDENLWEKLLPGNQAETSDFAVGLDKVGKSLAALSADDMPGAIKAFQLLAEKTDGSDRQMQRLLKSMGPEFEAVLVGRASDLGIQVGALSDAEKWQKLLEIATDSTTESTDAAAQAAAAAALSTEEQAAANQKLIESYAAGDASFIGFDTALSAMQEKQKAWAEQTAADTESSTDSWEDYYDGFSVNLGDYLGELQAQVDAQSAWEQNMILLSGRASQGVLDELSRMGPEGAPLVAQLVTASDDELAIMEKAFGERSEAGTTAFANNLVNARPVIAAAGAQLGEATAREIATKLANGTATVDQIMREYKLRVEGYKPVVDVSTAMAEARLNGFFTSYNGRRINITVDATGGEAYRIAGTNVQFRAGGGEIYGPGGPREDRVHVMASPGEFMINAEAYAKNRALVQAINSGITFGHLANGGPVQPQYASSSPVIRVASPAAPVVNMPSTLTVVDVNGQLIGSMKVAAVDVVRDASAGRLR